MLHCEIIQQVPGVEVVQPIHKQAHARRDVLCILRSEIRDNRFNVDQRVHRTKPLGCGNGLGPRSIGIRLTEQSLPLQIRFFDHISINDAKGPHARPSQQIRHTTPERSAPDDQDGRITKFLLTNLAKIGQQALPVVSAS